MPKNEKPAEQQQKRFKKNRNRTVKKEIKLIKSHILNKEKALREKEILEKQLSQMLLMLRT